MKRVQLIRVGAAGGLGGLVNAALCYFGWPAAIAHADFRWHILPAGLAHGSILATSSIGAGISSSTWRARWRWLMVLPIAWVVGYFSWIPLGLSVNQGDLRCIIWPFEGDRLLDAAWGPIEYFGGVTVILYIFVAGFAVQRNLMRSIIASSAAGIVGSLWFWSVVDHWQFSGLHGVIWGVLVGEAVWTGWAEYQPGRRTRG